MMCYKVQRIAKVSESPSGTSPLLLTMAPGLGHEVASPTEQYSVTTSPTTVQSSPAQALLAFNFVRIAAQRPEDPVKRLVATVEQTGQLHRRVALHEFL